MLAASNSPSFGMVITDRTFSSASYRYGFNGKEKDDEVNVDNGSYDYGPRFYNARLARFLSVDPATKSYPYLSTYAFAENDVIRNIDLDGSETLNKTVTSDPNKTTGEPGQATITIQKEYIVVTSGIAAVKNAKMLIDAAAFSKHYKGGNTTLYMTSLPSATSEGTFLTGKYERWARKAERGKEKYKEKLRKAGVNYYITKIEYQYSIQVAENVTLQDAIEWAEKDPSSRGIIAMQVPQKELIAAIKSGELKLLDDPESMLRQYLVFNKFAERDFASTPDAGGIGSILSITKYDFILLNPNTWDKSSKFLMATSVLTPSGDPEYTYDRTEALVHEGGHNATNLGHTLGYDYNTEGLSSNKHGKVYPTVQNTKVIINDPSNRKTIK